MGKEIIDKLYNLILDESITSEERKLLVRFKNKLAENENEQRIIMELAESIRLLSLKNVSKHIVLSSKMAEFYKQIAVCGERERNIARGIMSFGIFR